MKRTPILFPAAVLLMAAASTARAGEPAAVADFLRQADAGAADKINAARVEVGSGLDMHAFVDGRGRLTDISVARSSGSRAVDRRVVAALRDVRLPRPPNSVIGAEVNFAVRPIRIQTARAD